MTGDLFLSYPGSAVVARVALAFVVILSHPVVSYPASTCIGNSIAIICEASRGGRQGGQTRGGRKADSSAASGTRTEPTASAPTASAPAPTTASLAKPQSTFVTECRQGSIIACYLLVTTATALAVTDLGIVVSLAGAVAATMVVFIAPGACYVSLHSDQRWTTKMVLAALLCGVGCVLLPLLVLLVLASHGYFGDAWAI